MILAEGPDTIAAFIGEPVLGTGGIVPPPAGYWQKIQAVLDQLRHPADRRRSGDRLRPPRHDVRLRPLRHQARPHHHRQGPHLRLRAALGRRSLPTRSGRCWCKAPTSSARSAMAGPIPRTRSARPPASPTSKLIDELDLVANAGETGAYFRADLREARRPTTRMSARCAATACWRRSSSSPTGRPRLLRPVAQDRPRSRRRAARARRHRPRHAAGRHPRLRAAALPDARRSRRDRPSRHGGSDRGARLDMHGFGHKLRRMAPRRAAAFACPGATSRSTGTAPAQAGSATGQRVRKTQPEGTAAVPEMGYDGAAAEERQGEQERLHDEHRGGLAAGAAATSRVACDVREARQAWGSTPLSLAVSINA